MPCHTLNQIHTCGLSTAKRVLESIHTFVLLYRTFGHPVRQRTVESILVTKSTEGSWPQTTHNGNLVAVGVLPTVWHRHCAMHTSKSKLHTLHFISATSIASPLLLSQGSNSIALVFATCDLRPEKEGDDDGAGCFPISYCLSEEGSVASPPSVFRVGEME